MDKKFCENCGAKLEPGAMFCPDCGNKVEGTAAPSPEHKIPVPDLGTPPAKPKKSKLKIIGGVIGGLFLLVMLLGSMGGGGSSSSSSGKAPAKDNKVLEVRAEELIDDYSKDEAAAEEKYKDKKVSITGQLEVKHQFKNTQNYGLMVAHRQVQGKNYDVVIDVDKDDVTAANKVKQGDFVKAEGTCVGKVEQKDPNEISIQVKAKKLNE